ncbi:MAG: FkbM family methyltransferase [Rubripirellula sp.]
MIGLIPEGSAKNSLRRLILHFRTGMPRELMVNRGDTVVQVGMWHRDSARRLANSIGPNGRLVLIELSKDSLDVVKEAMEARSLHNVDYVNKGAWHTPGQVEIIVNENPSLNRIDTGRLHPGGDDGIKKMVDVDTIENICEEHDVDVVDYMEITINGAEVDAIRGMGKMLQATKRIWVAGLTRDPETGEPLNAAIAKELQSHGFSTKISRSKKSAASKWGSLDGHVYGWRNTLSAS